MFFLLLVQLLILIILNIIFFFTVKINVVKKFVLFFSSIYFVLLITSLLDKLKFSYYFIGFFIAIILFFVFIYQMYKFSISFKNILDAYNHLSNGNINYVLKQKSKDELKNLTRCYLQINMNFKSLVDNVNNFAVQLSDKIEKMDEKSNMVKIGIGEQQGTSQNLDSVLDLQGESIEAGAKGLDDTRMMFKKTSEIFSTLFNNINALFDQNLLIQNQNKNMENQSKLAFDFTKDLESITVDGTEKIDKIIGFIDNLDVSVHSIKEMIIMIKKITAQTNLLAMNASIEAAHAGEYGAGFSVVAEEIRNLAESSNNATLSITKIVDSIFQEMEKGKNYSKVAKVGVSSINEAINKTVSLIGDVSVSINQQIKSAVDMKGIIDRIHNQSKDIKDSAEYQQKRTQEIYESSENLNSQAIIIKAIVAQQKEQIQSLFDMINDLGKIVYDSNVYTLYLKEIIEKFLVQK